MRAKRIYRPNAPPTSESPHENRRPVHGRSACFSVPGMAGAGQTSHSVLCCSHHAGNAGSLGERVGLTIPFIPDVLSSAKKGVINSVSAGTPKYNNLSKIFLSLVQ